MPSQLTAVSPKGTPLAAFGAYKNRTLRPVVIGDAPIHRKEPDRTLEILDRLGDFEAQTVWKLSDLSKNITIQKGVAEFPLRIIRLRQRLKVRQPWVAGLHLG